MLPFFFPRGQVQQGDDTLDLFPRTNCRHSLSMHSRMYLMGQMKPSAGSCIKHIFSVKEFEGYLRSAGKMKGCDYLFAHGLIVEDLHSLSGLFDDHLNIMGEQE